MTVHDDWRDYGLPHYTVTRMMQFSIDTGEMRVADRWTSDHEKTEHPTGTWHLIFGPTISATKIYAGQWEIRHQNKVIGFLETSIDFEKADGWYSPGYGTCVPTTRLVGVASIESPALMTFRRATK